MFEVFILNFWELDLTLYVRMSPKLFYVLEMSRTVAFGRDILGAPDVDIEVY